MNESEEKEPKAQTFVTFEPALPASNALPGPVDPVFCWPFLSHCRPRLLGGRFPELESGVLACYRTFCDSLFGIWMIHRFLQLVLPPSPSRNPTLQLPGSLQPYFPVFAGTFLQLGMMSCPSRAAPSIPSSSAAQCKCFLVPCHDPA